MKAIVFSAHGKELGDLSTVKLAEIPRPRPKPNEITVYLKAAALNRLDLWVLAGWPGLNLHLPHIMGSDGAGIVAEVGENVTQWQVGDRVALNPTVSCGHCGYCRTARENLCDKFAVLGEHIAGCYAEYVAVPARNAIKLPGGFTFEEAAAASLVYVTAWHSLLGRGNFKAGETILIVGAGGGVNTAAIQISKLAGARRIIVIGSSDEKLAQAGELGADVLINRHKQPKWYKAVYAANDGHGVDLVVDNVGAATFNYSLRALRKGGRLVTVGNTSGAVFPFDNRMMFGKHLSIIGSTMGSQSDYEQVMALVFAGKLKPVIDSIYSLADGLTALQRLADGDVNGKLVLNI